MAVLGVVGRLTDETGISRLTSSKVLKDFVLDILLALPGALLAINVGNVQQAVVSSVAVAFVLTDTIVRALYRVLLRWAQTP